MRLLLEGRSAKLTSVIERIQENVCRSSERMARLQSVEYANRQLQAHRELLENRICEMRLNVASEDRVAFEETASHKAILGGYDLCERIGTRWDSPLALMELHDLWDELLPSLALMDQYKYRTTDLVLATTLHRCHNARIFEIKSCSTHVLLFNDRLFHFAAILAEVLASTLHSSRAGVHELTKGDVKTLKPVFEGNTQLDRALYRLLVRHGLDRWDGDVLSRPGEGAHQNDVAYAIYQAIKYFVMGHELAHVYLGHTKVLKHWPALSEPELPTAREQAVGFAQELEADFVGFEVGLGAAANNGIPLQLYMWACPLFFYGQSWLERFSNVTCVASERAYGHLELIDAYDTHPSPIERYEQLQNIVRMLSDDNTTQRVDYRLHVLCELDRYAQDYIAAFEVPLG